MFLIRGAAKYKLDMKNSKMEDERLKSLKKTKNKFLNQISIGKIQKDKNASLDEKMEKLISQAECLANFLLNKYQDIPSGELMSKQSKSSKRSRGKSSSKKKSLKNKGRQLLSYLSFQF